MVRDEVNFVFAAGKGSENAFSRPNSLIKFLLISSNSLIALALLSRRSFLKKKLIHERFIADYYENICGNIDISSTSSCICLNRSLNKSLNKS